MHSAAFLCLRWKLSQFSSWLKKHIGCCFRRLAFSFYAHPLSQQIKPSLIVLLFWTQHIHMMPSKALIIKSKYIFLFFFVGSFWQKTFSMNRFCSHGSSLCFVVTVFRLRSSLQRSSFRVSHLYSPVDILKSTWKRCTRSCTHQSPISWFYCSSTLDQMILIRQKHSWINTRMSELQGKKTSRVKPSNEQLRALNWMFVRTEVN